MNFYKKHLEALLTQADLQFHVRVLGIIIIVFSLLLCSIQTLVFAQMPAQTIRIAPGSSNPNTQNPFYPSSINLPVGIIVKWVNDDTVYHTVTSNSGFFDSGLLGPNEPWKWTFSATGFYGYYCKLHPYMSGSITVS